MNQTRTFLIFAWLVVATLLYMAWTQEQAAPPATATPATQEDATATGDTVPDLATGAAPKLPAAAPTMSAAPVSQAGTADAPAVTVTTDVLRVVLDGGAMRQADLLGYPQTTAPGADPMRLFASDPAHFYQAHRFGTGFGGLRIAQQVSLAHRSAVEHHAQDVGGHGYGGQVARGG